MPKAELRQELFGEVVYIVYDESPVDDVLVCRRLNYDKNCLEKLYTLCLINPQ